MLAAIAKQSANSTSNNKDNSNNLTSGGGVWHNGVATYRHRAVNRDPNQMAVNTMSEYDFAKFKVIRQVRHSGRTSRFILGT